MPDNRQLVAILFTDIEGYTALMQKDEQHAVTTKNRHREILQRDHKDFDGRIIQYYGDGSVSIFQSAVKAVKCAVAMQQAFSQSPQVPVRMGLHIGDIIFNEENIFGDSVNIASRIESLGVPGSVLISDKVNDEIHNHPPLKTVSVGIYQLKNVERPVEVFALLGKGLFIPQPGTLKGKTEYKKNSSHKSSPKVRRKTIALIAVVLLIVALVGYYLAISNNDYYSDDAMLGISDEYPMHIDTSKYINHFLLGLKSYNNSAKNVNLKWGTATIVNGKYLLLDSLYSIEENGRYLKGETKQYGIQIPNRYDQYFFYIQFSFESNNNKKIHYDEVYNVKMNNDQTTYVGAPYKEQIIKLFSK